MASWVSLNDLYVKTEGESTVNGTLKIVNSNTGTSNGLLVNQPGSTDSFYNVGDEIKTLRDSVSSITEKTKKIYTGAKIVTMGSNGIVQLFSAEELKSLTGSTGLFFIGASNGDFFANQTKIISTYQDSSNSVYVSAAEGWSAGLIRINFLLYCL